MRTLSRFIVLILLTLLAQNATAQQDYEREIARLKEQKERVMLQEKEALKKEIEEINERLEAGEISLVRADRLKEEAARKRALNIEDRLAILDNRIALLERNKGDVLKDNRDRFDIDEEDRRARITINERSWDPFESRYRRAKYDRRTYSDLVVAVGLNNAIIEGQSLDDTPYKVGGSRFFELGWAWRTRVFRNTNFMRINYGFSFQFNGLKPKDNMYFVSEGGQTSLQDFEIAELQKSKLRMDNLVFPLHLEFGPSRFIESEDKIRYSLRRQFRLGLGGYAGFNLGTRQKLKYRLDGDRIKDKVKGAFNTNDFIYGLSAYVGVEGILLYAKYDLNTIFKDGAAPEQRNISLGLRFDL
ncbi:porin family protein [Poritiphilus flavus]|uniref:PorT family protein n=1 Tax=Poritiphilus flavus TaxID=2697053 RepID=A0A6L9EII9_9FLAO|nr:hypothetical protein [Poritiphilus flavus]NAS13999.1 hypothetical protein [Poritiphilus flavus]